MANRNRTTTATTAAPAKAAPTLRAAAIIGRHGLAALPRVAAATGTAPASAKRYSAALNVLTPAFAAATFTLTAQGKAAVAQAGCIGMAGQPTAMGLTAVALANANGTASATGAQVVAAIIGNPQLMAAMLGTKAAGTHILPNTATAAKWAQGYVNGLCRSQHSLATKAA